MEPTTYEEWVAITVQHPEFLVRFFHEYREDCRAGEPRPRDRQAIEKLLRSLHDDE